MDGKSALITGSEGFIGRRVSERLLSAGWNVSGWDERIHPSMTLNDIGHLSGSYDAVIHLAGTSNRVKCESDPLWAYDMNVGGTLKVLRRFPKAHHIFMSTCLVYVEGRVEEDDALCPRSVYGKTKLMCEYMLENVKHTIFRGFNIYGKGMSGRHFLSELRKAKMRNCPITIYRQMPEETRISRDYLHIEDLTPLFEKALEWDIQGVFNAGSGEEVYLEDIAKKAGVPIEIAPLPEWEATKLYADIGKTRTRFYGWNPMPERLWRYVDGIR